MEKIIADGKHEGMTELKKVFDKAMYHMKEIDKDEYEHLEMCLYKAAYGKEDAPIRNEMDFGTNKGGSNTAWVI